jgi:TonB family protein
MKRLAYILMILILISSCNQKSNNTTENVQIENDEEILFESFPDDSDYSIEYCDTIDGEILFSVVEEMPQFGNGWEDIKKYILDNFQYPQTAIDDSIEGRVYLQFVINEDGSVSNAEVVRELRYDLDEECIRVIENMPDWKPGKQRGEFVKVRFVIPFIFKMSESDTGKGNVITPKEELKVKSIELKVFPNPAKDYVNIEILSNMTDLEYQLINAKGQIIKSGHIYNSTKHINISDIENGLYIVRLISKENGLIKTQKLIKN